MGKLAIFGAVAPPAPLFPLATTPLARFEASRAGKNEGALQGGWTDVIGGKVLAEIGGPRILLKSPGDGAYLEFPVGVGGELLLNGPGIPDAFTYAIVAQRAGGTVPNNFFNTDGWVSGVAGGGGWQALASSGSGGSGSVVGTAFSQDVWNVAFGSFDKATPSASRVKVNGNTPSGPGSVSATPTADLLRLVVGSSGSTGTLRVAAVYIWAAAYTAQQMADEFAAIQAGSPLV
jgi:hypothetical protein